MELRDRVILRMKELGLNEFQLAKKMGYKNNSTISSLLSGRTKTFRDMPRLATGLETTTEWLLVDDQKNVIPQKLDLIEVIKQLILENPNPVKAIADAIDKHQESFYNTLIEEDIREGRKPDRERYARMWKKYVDKSAFIIAYSGAAFSGCIVGVFIGWLIWH